MSEPCQSKFEISQALELGKSAHHRIDEHKERMDRLEDNNKILHEMNTNIKVLAEQTKGNVDDIKEVKNDLKDIKDKPAKKWDSLTNAIIVALASGLAGAFLMLVLK
jgi:DNA repair exonuclease SbcCD ATPase subunit